MMYGLGYFIKSVTRSLEGTLRPLDRLTWRSGRHREKASRPRTPATFTSFEDPSGLFVLRYPSDWELRVEDGIRAFSPQIGSFARVDLYPEAPGLWEDLAAAVRKAGGELRIGKPAGADPVRVRGMLRISGRKFDWRAWAWTVDGRRVVLSLGNVQDSGRGASLERYEDGILAAVRRGFDLRRT